MSSFGRGLKFFLIQAVLGALFILSFFSLPAWYTALSLGLWAALNAWMVWLNLQLNRPLESLAKALITRDNSFCDPELLSCISPLNALWDKLDLLEQEKREKEIVLESLEEGVLAVDGKGLIRYVNPAATKMFGLEKRQLQGLFLHEVVKKNLTILLKTCQLLISRCQEEGNRLRESFLLNSEKGIYLDILATPELNPGGAILVIQDTSIHHKVVEVGKDFIANASHELRTPITIIQGFAETLQDIPNISNDLLMDITDKILRNCQRMNTLVKNLLLLSDIENMLPSRLKSCNLIPLIENSIEIVQSLYPDAKIAFEKKEESLCLTADADLLELAIINLLHNAAKYSNEPIEISIVLIQERGQIEIAISDHGMGIGPQDIEHIFERFYTVNKAHSRKLGGTGLGLSMVKTIVEKHEGSISVESQLGLGSRFIISLPKAF